MLNEDVAFIENPPGRVVITVRLKRRGGFLSRFQPPVLERVIKLDELGSFVFLQVDNRKTTLDIIDAFVSRFRVNRREATLSTVSFLKSLVQRGVISIAVK
ncbi:MAG: PqqD family protein [Verrucomicrobia bacterium]|nr:PqqD family protein [Verrucomicrobiota bacterium]MCG2679838.1 PqqD family protein [Kiritimatiellia bacterium]MBU4248486.1 PqqD family protein [Verrucomicrobiota bacterium]MBU4290377.1 PqqD family protein [Verrucomicrobiota bacterium]MBU4429765.1 PqqD family protein [Verrucomicrobiota bacterium]